MKKLFAVVLIGAAVVATAAVATQKPVQVAPARVDLDQVNSKIDTRLHAMLGQLVARRAN